MKWRKWMVRGLVFGVLGASAAAALLYQAWTNPTATRHQVLAQLDKCFVGAHVSLDSARLRLLGGISFSDLRMTRRDDLDRTDFLYVPDGIIYHDKERLANGDLAIRKIELHRMRLRIVRERDGHWNVAGLLGPTNPNERVPMLVLQQATIVLEDRTTSLTGPLLEIKDVSLTLINDPLPTLTFEGSGTVDVAGPVRLSGKIQRASGELNLTLDAPAIPVGPALTERLAAVLPDAAPHIRTLRGEGHVMGSIAFRPGAAQPLTYDTTVSLTKAEFSHARLPWALKDGEVTARIVNGSVPLAHITARSGPTTFDMTLRDLALALPPGYSVKDDGSVLTDLVREVDARFEHVRVDDNLFKYLPDNLQPFNVDYSPSGYMSMTHTFRKEDSGRWRKHWVLTAEDMRATYRNFQYPVERITGTAEVDYDHEVQPQVKLDLVGFSRDRPITLKGVVHAAKANSGIAIDIAAERMPLDEKLYKALPKTSQRIVDQYRPKSLDSKAPFPSMGLGDFKVELRQRRGTPDLRQTYFITFHDATLCYDAFPYPLENVTGVLELHPDHWEAKHFRGTHNGGELTFDAHSEPLAGPASAGDATERVRVKLQGRRIPLDADFLAALAPHEVLHQTWTTLHLAGRMNFDATVADANQPQDVDIGVSIDGCSMKPDFFPYLMEKISGTFGYAKGCVTLDNVQAHHGDSVLRLRKGQIFLKRQPPGAGGFQVRLDAVQGWPVVPDGDFLAALPVEIREGLKSIKLQGPLYAATSLVVDAAADPRMPVMVWWDGTAFLRNATLQTGLEVSQIDGKITCCGMKKDNELQMVGHIALDNMTLLNQPIRNINARYFVQPNSPNVLRIHDLNAQLFGGAIGGEGRVDFDSTLKYDMTIKALNMRLEEFGRHNFGKDADIQGPVCAGLHLMGEGRDIGGMKGHGRVFVRDARLYKLPALLDLVKAFGLRLPDRTAFEQASATFAIDGPQMQFEDIDLVGNAISLRGQGTAGLNGENINLDFNADWARLGQFLPEAASVGPRWVSDQLLKVKVRGRLGDVRFEPVIVPGVTDLFTNEK